ncbi:MAG TPA: DUF4097 family beta strand repeat-containing protein [Candidatus Acidoferrales bacterium]|nr:DUF4097 family beta strand repeat-containing protein [Candidatus Acidoferrales bacterium]
MRKWLAGTAFAILALFSGAAIQAADQQWTKTFPLAAGGSFALVNVNGSADVRGWDRDSVEIRAVKSARNLEDLQRVSIEAKAMPGRVEIITHYPEEEGVDVAVEFHVRVPSRVTLERIVTVNGNVDVAGVEGKAVLHTVNGNVNAFNCAGSFSARTTNGNIREELLGFNADAALETVNGSVIIALPKTAGAQVEAQSVNGEVRTELSLSMLSGYVPGKLEGKLGNGGPALHLHSVNGAIQIAQLKPTA